MEMRFTEEMIAEDEKRWHARDVVTELGYCSTYMRDRKDMTNLEIRFYAYIMRRAHGMLKAQEPKYPIRKQSKHGWFFYCPKCEIILNDMACPKYCSECGQEVKWE